MTNAGGPAWLKVVDANMRTPIELIKATVDGMAARGFQAGRGLLLSRGLTNP